MRRPHRVPPLTPFETPWCADASDWIVAHKHDIERVFTRVYQETFSTLGGPTAQSLHILDIASLLQAAAEAAKAGKHGVEGGVS